jgi:alcohol dehydrogenase class IV
LFGGLALANARLGAVHGFAAPLGGMFPAPHGAICARLLPPVCLVNQRTLQQRQPDSPLLPRFTEAACLLTGKPQASAADGVAWLEAIVAALHIPALATYGVTRQDFPELAEKAARASSMQGNPIRLTTDELLEILELAL